jgi:hypothetical protein
MSKEEKMENKELIQDTGLFVGQKLFEFSLTESFESITNLFKTIKEYRDFANPDDAAWFEYIHEIFHIFGFSTVKVAQRLITLQEMGANQTPKALVCIIGPKEDFNQIVFGLDWESYLFYAAKFHQVNWVILTNGLQFKILNYANDADTQKYFRCEFEEIVKNGKTDSFFTLYKIFYLINKGSENGLSDQNIKVKKPGKKGPRVIVERHLVRKEFWSQLLPRSKSKMQLFSKKAPSIEHYLGVGAGKKGITYNYIIAVDHARVELYIDNGHGDWNKSAFDSLAKNKQKIEDAFGDSFKWERLDDKRASVIRFSLTEFGLRDKDKWPELQDQMIEAMIKFEKAFGPYIKKIV